MQQKTTEPDHKGSGFKKKMVAAALISAVVGLGFTTSAHAVSGPTTFPTTDSSEKTTFLSKIGPYDVAAAEAQSTVLAQEIVIAPAPPPPPPVADVFLAAARAQLGTWQDCTALVEKSLRAIGYSVGDLSPMGFESFGVRVAPEDAQPGDIMMRWGHVAIYAGDGVAIHGGYNGSTVEIAGRDSSPYSYSMIIRVVYP